MLVFSVCLNRRKKDKIGKHQFKERKMYDEANKRSAVFGSGGAALLCPRFWIAYN